MPDPTVRRLSLREYQVASLVADGLKDAVIARRLGLSPSTVASYIRHARYRLQLASRAELAAWVRVRRSLGYPEERLRRADPERLRPPHTPGGGSPANAGVLGDPPGSPRGSDGRG